MSHSSVNTTIIMCHVPSADTYTLTCTHGESLETVRWRTNKHTQSTKQWTTATRQSDDMAHAAGRTKVHMPTSRYRRSCQEHRAWARMRAAVARTVDNHTRGHTRTNTRQRCMRPVPSPMTHHPHPTHPLAPGTFAGLWHTPSATLASHTPSPAHSSRDRQCDGYVCGEHRAASPTIVQVMLLAGTGVPHRDRVTATPLALAQLTDRVWVPEPPQGTLHTDHGVVTKLYCPMTDSTVRGHRVGVRVGKRVKN